MEKIEALIFDLGRVLVDVDLTRGIFKYTLQGKSPSEKEVLDTLMTDTYYQEYACGRVSARQFHQKFCNTLNLSLDFESFKAAWNDVFKTIPGMQEMVIQLKKKYKIGLLSDIGPLHWEHLNKILPVLKQINQPILSYKIGYLKPHREAYLLAAKSVEAAPANCLFIDDREVNVNGAHALGMKAVQFQGIMQLKKDLEDYGIHLT